MAAGASPAEDSIVTLNDSASIKTTKWYSGPPFAWSPADGSRAFSECTSGETRKSRDEVLMGQLTNVIQVGSPAQGRRFTFWKAPQLGCVPIQYRTEVRKSREEPYALESEGRLVRLSIAEPEPVLLDAGANYTELSPSLFELRGILHLGLTESARAASAAAPGPGTGRSAGADCRPPPDASGRCGRSRE